MRNYSMTPSEVALHLAAGETVPASELPLIHSGVSSRTIKLTDPVVVESSFADGYGIGRRYRSMGTLALHLGCPLSGNVLEWLVREVRVLWEQRRN